MSFKIVIFSSEISKNLGTSKHSVMSANPKLRQSVAETEPSKQTDGTKAPAQPKRRRNRPSKAKKVMSEPSKQNADAPKSKERVQEEKFVHTVFGGMSKEKFIKQKEVRFGHQSKSGDHKEPMPRSLQRKVTVTANKSVIVSILDPALNHHDLKADEKITNCSSSLNEAYLPTRINDQADISLNIDQGQMDNNYKFEFELEKNYVYRIKKVR